MKKKKYYIYAEGQLRILKRSQGVVGRFIGKQLIFFENGRGGGRREAVMFPYGLENWGYRYTPVAFVVCLLRVCGENLH